VRVPAQLADGGPEARAAFLDEHRSVVVKPARGEQHTTRLWAFRPLLRR
jgi:hypothetical protein